MSGKEIRPNEFLLKNNNALGIFGKLVRDWATGAKDRPDCLDAFKHQLSEAGIGKEDYELHPDIKKIEFVDRQSDSFKILLPLAERVKWANEDGGKAPNNYTLPQFYIDLDLQKEKGRAVVKGYEYSAEDLDHLRLGDYCTSQCM